MADGARFRFGVQLTGPAAGTSWADTARRAEDLGYSTLLMPDHFNDQLAPVPALMAAADATTVLRVGSLVWGVDYRHPVLLAKAAATIDLLSGGRFEFGLGAGWMSADYLQSGIKEDEPTTRVDRLEEALAVCRGLWQDEKFSFHGTHYRIKDLDGLPKPAQKPHPPILVGGGGRRILSIAARTADIVGINPPLRSGQGVSAEMVSPFAVDDRVAHVRSQAGARLEQIELNIMVMRIHIGADWPNQRSQIAESLGSAHEDLDASPYIWLGEEARVIEHIREIRERWGISYFVLHGHEAMEQAAPIVSSLSGQ